MEQFTNDNIKFFDQIIKELQDYDYDENWEIQFQYAEVPYLLRYGFSFCFLKNGKETKFLQRTWNSEYDRERFNLGVFNLDRLAVTQKDIHFNEDEKIFFNSINLSTLNTVEYKGIVIDGLFCEMKIPKHEKKFEWNIDKEMNSELEKVISKIRAIQPEGE
jgi:hypothetical protein